jgi:non-ribosomal peptide synthase protein (TIGR01720 family)
MIHDCVEYVCLAADISFNYLGQFDQVASNSGGWRFASESPGQVWDGKTPRPHLIDITAVVVDGSLRFTWTYSRAAFRRETIERLSAALVGALRTLIQACTRPGAGGWTPSDFSLARLDQRSIDLFQATYPGMADVYPLSPLQHGLLFHALDGSSTGAYVEQVSCAVDAPFDPVAFQAAWAQIIERHAVLRTVFDWEAPDHPVQIVLDRIAPAWSIEDWREAPADQRGADLDAWLAADVARGFQLNHPPLLRFALIRLNDNSWRFVWSFHHILIDGWCLPIILKEVAAAYASIVAGRHVEDVRHQPYRDYIAWLQKQDGGAAETFWRRELKGFTTATSLPINRTSAGSGECRAHLAETATSGLQALARREQITMSTVVQAAWAIVLARCTGERDVVFGTTMAGRPAGLTGVESMIGLFINTLPLRTEIGWNQPVLPWLKLLQERLLAIREYEHVGLSDVQRWSDVGSGNSLFESFVVFENYPVDAKAPAGAAGLRLRDFSVRERSNFARCRSWRVRACGFNSSSFIPAPTLKRRRGCSERFNRS